MNMVGLPNRVYRVGINVFARAIRRMMRANEIQGSFCIGAQNSFYEIDNMRFVYHYDRFGVAGNIDSGGTSEFSTRTQLARVLKPEDVFFDVGAHEGLFSVFVKKIFPTVSVHAFEPQPASLFENLRLNNVQVAVHQLALGDKSGQVYMTSDLRSSNHVAATGLCVPAEKIDVLVAEKRIPPPNIIKLDVEGFEFEVLRGAQFTLNSFRPVIICEINDCILRYHRDLQEFFQYMTNQGYSLRALNRGKFQSIDERHYNPSKLGPSEDSNFWWVPVSGPNSQRL
jgi:FkbM family methyltransferase